MPHNVRLWEVWLLPHVQVPVGSASWAGMGSSLAGPGLGVLVRTCGGHQCADGQSGGFLARPDTPGPSRDCGLVPKSSRKPSEASKLMNDMITLVA